MARNGVRNSLQRPMHLARHLRRFGASALAGLRARDTRPLPHRIPRAPFNGMPGPQRVLACADFSLERVKALKKHFDVTLNDLVLAITGGAVRRHLQRQDALPDRSLVALVPMSTRSKGDKRVGNQITECSVTWGTHLDDPEERLRLIRASATQAKASARSSGANLMGACGEALPPGLFRLMYLGARNVDVPIPGNAVVSNVRGATFPLYMAGARIEALYPMSVLAPTQGLNFTVVSYCGRFFFGITADPDLVHEPWLLAEDLDHALVELEEAAERRLKRAG
jgi:WS/DGAT/MGAT family acyltransferase